MTTLLLLMQANVENSGREISIRACRFSLSRTHAMEGEDIFINWSSLVRLPCEGEQACFCPEKTGMFHHPAPAFSTLTFKAKTGTASTRINEITQKA